MVPSDVDDMEKSIDQELTGADQVDDPVEHGGGRVADGHEGQQADHDDEKYAIDRHTVPEGLEDARRVAVEGE